MNLILEETNQVPYFTELGSVLRAMRISACDYDWYLSDVETNRAIPGFSSKDHWLAGESVNRLVKEQEIQFIWGVFSAVPKGIRPEIVDPPYADGNRSFWQDPDCTPQLEGALFEIVCWDSSATLLIGVTEEMATNFAQVYSHAKALSASR